MQNKQSIDQKLKYQTTDKRKILSVGTLIALCIVLSPILFYAYQGFPDVKSWESFFGTIDSKYYESINTLAWVVFGKVVPFILLLIWFFTCKHWWYHSIIVPISMYVFQIITSLNQDLSFNDTNELLYTIPIIAIVAAITYTIRTKIFDRLYGVNLDQELKRVRWNGKIVTIPADSPLDLQQIDDESDEIIEEEEEDDDVF
ncbi:hypothetical protein MED134_04769 [Dokdonia sp. MED134]|uniref:hypothetical protein n=1 Tax=Dokdonia sp. MED134 TaxID=313590 RepID=UPI000068AACB|nr:hypothetical protein [Dokdonia sp. MED134]EAQ40037.1 hypothetical protein MED134_04769 [Dokdonia sp. MED134]